MKQSVGIIGLGSMGAPMARRLMEAGFPLRTYVRSEHSLRRAQALQIPVCASPKELALQSDTILLLVSNGEQCEQCLSGDTGVFAAEKECRILLSSTVSPEMAKELAQRCPAGMHLLDAPISGGVSGAEQGTLVSMVAGDADTYEACLAVLECYSKRVVYVGSQPGQAQQLKSINQLLVSIHMAATAEADALAEGLGLDPQLVFETICDCAGDSAIFRSRMPKLICRDFSPRATLETLEKDTGIILSLAQQAQVPCYLTQLCHELYTRTPRPAPHSLDACSVLQLYQTEKEHESK
jgi:3-hydroxyisobutyrate dehydrogenase-like beta-hydroxyacid dehydrogenase